MDTQPFNAPTALSGLTHRLSELGFDQLPVAAAGYVFSPFAGNPVAMAGALLELGETVRPWVTTFLDRNGPALQAWAATQNPADVGRWIRGLDLSGLDDAFGGVLGGIDLAQVGDWVGSLDLGNLDLGNLNLQNLDTDWLTGALRFGRSAAPRDRLVIIDGAVGDLDTLLAGIDRSTTDVLILDPTQDGIAQISTALNGRSGLRAIDLISHGESGSLQLGSSMLDLAALGDRAAELATWATAIAPGADLHLYGCNVAAGATGEAFLQQLHQQLGADIAASDDLSGYGGDWDFERFIGQIETDVAVSRNLLAAYRDTLATITVNSTADTIADDGLTTLREAIISINNAASQPGVVATGDAYGTNDTIVFDPTVFSTPKTINLDIAPGAEGVNGVNAALGDLDITRNVTITGPGAHLLTIDSLDTTRVFHINGNQTVTLSGMTITGGGAGYNGPGAGILIDDSNSIVTLDRISIRGSRSSNVGSAISVLNDTGSAGSLTIRQSAIINNIGDGPINGEAVRVRAGSLRIENSTFSGNASRDRGDVRIFNLSQATVIHSTFYGSGATDSRAIFNDPFDGSGLLNGNYTVTNSLVKNYTQAFETFGVGVSPTQVGNFVDLDNSLLDASKFDTTPALNGGTTESHAIFAAATEVVNTVTASVLVDQRGLARPTDPGQGDRGAFELVVSTPPIITLKNNGGGVVDPFLALPSPTMRENNPAPGVAGLDRPRTLAFDPTTTANFSQPNANTGVTIAVDDTDSPNITVGLSGINGIIDLNDATLTGLPALTVMNDATSAVTLMGSPADINAALRGLIFTPTSYVANEVGGPAIGIAVAANDGANLVNQTYNIVVGNEATAPILAPTNMTVTGAVNTPIPVGDIFTPLASKVAARDTDPDSVETIGAWRANTAADDLDFEPGRIIFDGIPAGVTVLNGVTPLTAVSGPDMDFQPGFEEIEVDGDQKAVYEIDVANLPNLRFQSTAVQSFPVKFYLWSRENNITSRYTGLEQEITVNVTGSPNAAPILTGDATFPPVTENITPAGQLISGLFTFGPGNLVTDLGPDTDPSLRGIAVVGNAADPLTEGVWEYLPDGGSTWIPIPDGAAAPTDAAALMLKVDTQLRFRPVATYAGDGTQSLTVRAVDNTYLGGFSTDSTPAIQAIGTPGLASPFSADARFLQVAVVPAGANTAPSFTGPAATLAAIAAGTTNPPGDSITNLFGAIVTDPDDISPLSGLAIIGNSAIATQGTWQYSTDGTNWFAVGTVADDATALALSATSRLRFVPAAGFTGAPPALGVRAIDDTFAGPFTNGATRQLTDAAANGGTTAISDNTAQLNTSITAVVVPPPPPPPPVPTPTPVPAPAPPSPGNLVVTIAGGGPLSDGTPNDIVLGAIAPGAVFETTLTLQNSTGNTTTLGAIQLPPGFTLGNPLPSSLGAGQQANIRLLFSSTTPGPFKGIIGIPTNGVPDGLFNFPVVITIDGSAPTPTPTPTPTPPGEPGGPTPTPTPPGEPGVPTPPGPSPVPGPSPTPTPTPDPGGEDPTVPPAPPVPPGGPLPLSVLPAIDLLDFKLGTGAGASLANLLFDPNFYLAQNPQAAAEVAAGLAQDLFDHYVKFGQFAGLSPSGAFDEALYRQLNPDIVPLIGGPITSGFDHYVKFGQFENRYTPLLLFDLGYYLATNPDLRGTIAPTDVAAGLGHFLSTGQKAGRNPSALFDAAFYAQRHPEALAAVQGGQAAGLFDYFVRFGLKAGHVPMPTFDGAQYLLDNPEAQGAIAAGQFSGPFEHYLIQGIGQGRGQGALLFDADFYLANHPQVAQGIAQGDFLDAYDQFIRFGQFAGWQPNPTFEEQTYLRNNPDVKAQVDVGAFETGVEHYILFGRTEGRKGMA